MDVEGVGENVDLNTTQSLIVNHKDEENHDDTEIIAMPSSSCADRFSSNNYNDVEEKTEAKEQDSLYEIAPYTGKKSEYPEFSRIEKPSDVTGDESVVIPPTRVHFETSFVDQEHARVTLYDFSTMIHEVPYLVSIYTVQASLFALFFDLSTGRTKIKRLSSTWKNPPIVEGVSRDDWYRENIASVMLNSRGPEATPKRPPKRRPPHHPSIATEGASGSSDQSAQQSEEELFAVNEKLRRLENTSKENEERLEREIKRLREDLAASKCAVAEHAERFRSLADEYEGRLTEWRRKFADSEVHNQNSQQEWKHLLEQREVDLARHKQESEAQFKSMKQKLVDFEATHSANAPVSPGKRQKIEGEVWKEAETVLAMARADLKEMKENKIRAERYAEDKKKEAMEAISTCDKIVALKTSELLIMKQQYESIDAEKQMYEHSLKEWMNKCTTHQVEMEQLKLQLEMQKKHNADLTKQLTGLLRNPMGT